MLCKDSKYINFPNHREKRLGKRKEENDKGKKKKKKRLLHLQYQHVFLKSGSRLSELQTNKK